MHKPNLSKYEDGSQVYLVYASSFDVESSEKKTIWCKPRKPVKPLYKTLIITNTNPYLVFIFKYHSIQIDR